VEAGVPLRSHLPYADVTPFLNPSTLPVLYHFSFEQRPCNHYGINSVLIASEMHSHQYGRRSMDGQGDMSPLLFEVEGTSWVYRPPYFFEGRHNTNAHSIQWMIGAIFVIFIQLILVKIKTVGTRCQILRLKCTKFNLGWGCAPDPAGELQHSPGHSSWI